MFFFGIMSIRFHYITEWGTTLYPHLFFLYIIVIFFFFFMYIYNILGSGSKYYNFL